VVPETDTANADVAGSHKIEDQEEPGEEEAKEQHDDGNSHHGDP